MIIERHGINIDLSYPHKQACGRCRKQGRDKSGDNLHVYGLNPDGRYLGAKCFACEYTIPSEDWLEENGHFVEEEYDYMGSHFDEAVHEKIKGSTGLDSKGYRGIRTDISKYFGVRYQYSETDGSVVATYYPTTQGYKISGYKVRKHPKDFAHPYGETGKDCELFGQFRFRTNTSICLIVGGEHDLLAAYQMLSDNQKNKQYDAIAVVSSTVGESGAYKQVQNQYAFFNQFKKIVVAMDADKAGEEAADKIVKVLPRGKAYLMKQRHKDPNHALQTGNQQDFINDFWAAKPYTPAGVHASTELYKAAVERLDLKMISLPSFMGRAAEMLGGGFVKKEMAVILAKTSIGKTTLISGLCAHLAKNEPEEVVGVLSLEADAGKFSLNLLSYHLQTPLHRLSAEARHEYLERDDIRERAEALYVKADGSPSLYVCDDRGASWEQIREKLLEMIINMGITVLIVDPYSDLLSGMTVSEQEEVATWFKKAMKEYGITPIIVSHVRKSANGGNGGPITEDDAQGSSFLVKASGQTLALERDKQSESSLERNRTYVTILKNRDFGETGPAGSMYYDMKTANLYDYDQYISEHPELIDF